MATDTPEIMAWFVPRHVPAGQAPDYIKERWVDVPLPLRYVPEEGPKNMLAYGIDTKDEIITVGDGVSVLVADAVKALRVFEKDEAAQYWQLTLGRSDEAELVFRAHEGQIFPASFMERFMPGIETFDQIR